jgi:hypothetical protein
MLRRFRQGVSRLLPSDTLTFNVRFFDVKEDQYKEVTLNVYRPNENTGTRAVIEGYTLVLCKIRRAVYTRQHKRVEAVYSSDSTPVFTSSEKISDDVNDVYDLLEEYKNSACMKKFEYKNNNDEWLLTLAFTTTYSNCIVFMFYFKKNDVAQDGGLKSFYSVMDMIDRYDHIISGA